MTLSLALAAFALTLGGAAHCAAMCGGFVVAASRSHPIAMHAGRIASYALIGAVAGAAASLPLALASSPALHQVLFIAACAILAVSGLRMAGGKLPLAAHSRWTRAIGLRASAAARRLGAPSTPLRAFALGGLWGWAPCALVYGALPLALVSGSFASGALVMAAFGIGTLPAVAGAGWLLARIARPGARAWVGGAMVALALVGALHALMPEAVLPALL